MGVVAGSAASAAGSSVANGERAVREVAGGAGWDPMAGVGRGGEGLGFGGGRRH